MRSHGPLHEPPDHKGKDQHHAQRIDPGRSLEEDVVAGAFFLSSLLYGLPVFIWKSNPDPGTKPGVLSAPDEAP